MTQRASLEEGLSSMVSFKVSIFHTHLSLYNSIYLCLIIIIFIVGGQYDSREARMLRSLERVQTIGSHLGLKQILIDAGKHYYKLAHQKQLIQGRSIE